MARIPELKKLFTELIAADRLSHGYLFFGSGARGEEALAFALSLSRYMETGVWEGGVILLDTNLLTGREVGIAEIRSAIHFLWEQPLRSRRKLLIIQDADALTVPASQALLKIVEEPPLHANIMLIAKDLSGVLPALVSRLQRIYISGNEPEGCGEEETARKLLTASSARERSELLKTLLEEDIRLPEVVTALLALLRRQKLKNTKLIGAILRRWNRMERYATNRKLQLEAAFAEGTQ
jgi:DNA polymerase III delta prime subunit